MAAQPKKKLSNSRRRKRVASLKLQEKVLVVCSNCGQKTLSHKVCANCGFYKGRPVFEAKEAVKVTKVDEK